MIAILGVPGSGKSTLAKLMSAREHMLLLPEPVETNPYLTDYYRDPERYAFPMQMFLLHKGFLQAMYAQNESQCVMDMHMLGNDLFVRLQYANSIMSKTDHQTYMDVSNTLKSLVKPPDLVVYLQCSTSVAVQRIMKRGRPSELDAPIRYWYDLGEVYERWFETYTDGKKLLINVDDLDFVSDESDEDYIIDSIMEYLND